MIFVFVTGFSDKKWETVQWARGVFACRHRISKVGLYGILIFKQYTLPENSITPENGGPLEKEIPIENPPFLGDMLVLGSVYQHPPTDGV